MTMAQENQETDKLRTIKRIEPEEIQIFYFTKLNPYPSYKKILNEIITNKEQTEFYTKPIHMEFKEAYENQHVCNQLFDTDN